ncbi:hypothetical protein ONS95_001830 [Cadophora gregata]|uniref:uncharacterized protein n=1 Tax=Cadophora gregata TaxID=51156 RepID=UPI0026DB8922|nr:uncharacterized protein ONS95_001830 [Cadophora gregata]KAK0111475.1 hypothetical protein ONS95_001830 [Cadophora gregata]KAK0112049.1 hypothetical protein ONS96_001309 [Cadophora gregata f. sp. sojae]
MENKLISFLGDPNFPSKIAIENSGSDRGERIRLYEDFYRQYSRLDFTRWTDRPIAISGLQKRLLRDLEVEGGFGVFDDGRSLLQRSLLWKRAEDVSTLEKVLLLSGEPIAVPSWSWMGYKNPIDYLDLPLGDVYWTPDEIVSPWTGTTKDSDIDGSQNIGRLKAVARGYTVAEDHETRFRIFYDMDKPSEARAKTLKCVVMGRAVAKTRVEETTHYVLVITPISVSNEESIYERAGVGYMAGSYIDFADAGLLQMVTIH